MIHWQNWRISLRKQGERANLLRWNIKLCRLKLSKDLWETVSAFSNTSGGLILLGYEKIKERYVPMGVENPSQVLDDFSSLVGQKFNFCPLVRAEILEDDKELAEEWKKTGLNVDVVMPVPESARPAALAMAATMLVRARAARFVAGVLGFVAGLVVAAAVAALARRRRRC